jgi:hypothetical protein
VIAQTARTFTISLGESAFGWVRLLARNRQNKTWGPRGPLNLTTNMKHIVPVIAVATVLTLGAWTPAYAEEEKEQTVQMSDLPAAVQTTIKDKAGSNELIKIEKKTEEGKTVYEAVINKKGKEWSIEVDANGKFLKQYQESKEKEEKGEKY